MQWGWIGVLGTVGGALTAIVLLVGTIVTWIAYFKKGKSRIALLGAIGFLLMLLLSCCSFSWGLADLPILRELPSRSRPPYYAIKGVVLFLLGLVNLLGLALLISAVWSGGSKE